MAAGRRRAACRAGKGTAAASKRCAGPIRAAGEIGIKFITIFSFSSENWSRPANEIGELMGLLRRFIRNDLAELHKSNVRVRIIGERNELDPDIGRLLVEAEELTKDNDGLTLVVAFNYGARQEITRAAQRIAEGRGARAHQARRRDHGQPSADFSTRPIFPIPISSSAPAASSGCRISCFGSRPIANWCSCRPIGPTSTAPRSKRRSANTNSASAGSAAWSRRPDPDTWPMPRAILRCVSYPPR